MHVHNKIIVQIITVYLFILKRRQAINTWEIQKFSLIIKAQLPSASDLLVFHPPSL